MDQLEKLRERINELEAEKEKWKEYAVRLFMFILVSIMVTLLAIIIYQWAT